MPPFSLMQEILIEKGFICQNPHPAISFHGQNSLSKYLYFYHLKYKDDVGKNCCC